ncbi:MAG: BlaI/MecI/CopY family transcriptional regulator [Bacillota bacterium]
MSRTPSPRPTDSELAILGVLWRRGPSTVRQVYQELNAARPTGYTTVLKLMQIMFAKGLVLREEAQRTHIYRSALPQEDTQRQLITDLLDRAFEGSTQKLILQALAASKAPPEELAQIRKLIDEYKGGQK